MIAFRSLAAAVVAAGLTVSLAACAGPSDADACERATDLSGQIEAHIRNNEPTTIEEAEAWGDEAHRLADELRKIDGSDALNTATQGVADATDQMTEAFEDIRSGDKTAEDQVWASLSDVLKGSAAVYTECSD